MYEWANYRSFSQSMATFLRFKTLIKREENGYIRSRSASVLLFTKTCLFSVQDQMALDLNFLSENYS